MIKRVYRTIEDYFVIALISLATLIVCYSVFMRYVMNAPVTWNEEIVCYMQVWIAYVGISIVARNQDEFIRFDFLIGKLKPRTRSIVLFVEYVLVIALLSVLAVVSFKWLIQVYRIGGISTPMKVPNYLPRIVIPVSFVLLLIHYIEHLAALVADLRGMLRKAKEER